MTEKLADKRIVKSAVWALWLAALGALLLLCVLAPHGTNKLAEWEWQLKLMVLAAWCGLTWLLLGPLYHVGPLDRAGRIGYLRTIILAGYVLAMGFHYLMSTFGYGYPRDRFLYITQDRFMDFINILRGCQDLDPYLAKKISYIGGYPPFAYVLGFLFSRVELWLVPLAVFAVGGMACLWFQNRRQLDLGPGRPQENIANAVVFTFLTYPFLFVMDRGNFDLIMFVLLVAFLHCLRRDKPYAAAVFLALSIALKIYSAVFLALLLAQRRYRAVLLACILTVALTAGSLAVMEGGFERNWQAWQESSRKGFAIGVQEGQIMRFSSSVFTLLYVLIAPAVPGLGADKLFLWSYSGLALLVLGAAGLYVWFGRPPLWKQVCLLTCLMILLPQTSGDYRLMMLFLPMWLFVNTAEASPRNIWFVLLFGLLLIPKNYDILYDDRNVAMVLNPVLLVALTALLFGGRQRPPKAVAHKRT